MRVCPTAIADVLIIEPKVFDDQRRFFYESWNECTLHGLAIDVDFVQADHSMSQKGALRRLHYQFEHPQETLVRMISGEVFDVAVDLRIFSATFGRWVGFTLSVENKRAAWIPPSFAHGFCVIWESAAFLYKTTDYWDPAHERKLLWSDAQLSIPWPLTGIPCLLPRMQTDDPLRV